MLGGPTPITLDIHLKDSRVVNEPVNGGQRHGRIGEDGIPFSERLVGRDQHRAAFVSGTYEFKQNAGLGLIFGDVGNVIEDHQMELVEFCDGTFEDEITACLLQFLDQICGSAKENAVPFLDKRVAYCRGKMRLAHTRRAEQQDIAALYVSLELANGISFDDPNDVLEGSGKLRRHVKLRNLGDLDAKCCQAFLMQAVATI